MLDKTMQSLRNCLDAGVFTGVCTSLARTNIDDNQETAVKFNLMSIPTLMLFRHGEVKKTVIGAYPKRKLEEELEPALA